MDFDVVNFVGVWRTGYVSEGCPRVSTPWPLTLKKQVFTSYSRKPSKALNTPGGESGREFDALPTALMSYRLLCQLLLLYELGQPKTRTSRSLRNDRRQ